MRSGKILNLWRAAWSSGNNPLLDAWWGKWKPQPGAINRDETPRTGEVSVADLKSAQAKAQAEEDEEATVRMRSLRRSEPVSGVDCRLPLDERGKPYLRMQSEAPTEKLVATAVVRFWRLTGKYPHIIYLSLPRYMAFEEKYFLVGKLSIKIDCEGLVGYDILLKMY